MLSRLALVASLVTLTLPAVGPAQTARSTPVSRATIAQVTDSLATAALRAGPVAALSIAVVRGRDTVVMKGYGQADLENDVAATARTVHRIGSVTKQFTSVAIMQLVEEGRIGLDDEVTKHPRATRRTAVASSSGTC